MQRHTSSERDFNLISRTLVSAAPDTVYAIMEMQSEKKHACIKMQSHAQTAACSEAHSQTDAGIDPRPVRQAWRGGADQIRGG